MRHGGSFLRGATRGRREAARRRLLCGWLVGGLVLLVSVSVRSEPAPITTRLLPAEHGVTVEASAIVEAPAAHVAALAGDAAAFRELLPAEDVHVMGQRGPAQLLQITMHQPWPVGVVRWVETLRRHLDNDGKTWVVERRAEGEDYYRHMHATWRIAPLDAGRCRVVYLVSMELRQWAPKWLLRRGMTTGMASTLERLRRLSQRPAR